MNGSNVTGLTYSQGDGTLQVVFVINGIVQPSQTYSVTIPASATVAGGTNMLGNSYTFNFTTAATIPPSPSLVLNPGFEIAGSDSSLATNWTVLQVAGGPVFAIRTNDNPHSGAFNFEVHLASIGSGPVAEFTQTGVPVTGGTAYPFTFCANALAGSAGYSAQWRILWNNGGDTGYQAFVPGNNTYVVTSNSVTAPATATAATLYFHFAGAANVNQSATIDIDDVSLGAANSTGTGDMIQTNVVPSLVSAGAAISWPTLVQSNYWVQGAVDLKSSAGWTNLSTTIIGDGTTNAFFDPIGTNSHRFYRVLLSP
jgi:hypothetical protein